MFLFYYLNEAKSQFFRMNFNSKMNKFDILGSYLFYFKISKKIIFVKKNMQRYFLSLAYKGTNFHGWQTQPNAKSIQEELLKALKILTKNEVCIQGAGRTDTGVHASFFVAHIDIETKIKDLERFVKNLNGLIGKDIVVFDFFEVENDMHSRFSAISRTYKYFIHQQKNVFLNNYSLYFQYSLDIQKMNQACQILKEYDDFASFQKSHADTETTLCNIEQAFWQKKDNQLVFTITANRFLRNMVRSIVGTMLEIGQSRISIDDFRKILEAKDRSTAGTSVDACGLFLTDIAYPEPVNSRLQKSRYMAKVWFNV